MKKGARHSKEAKAKMRTTKKGRHFSPKTEFQRGHEINLGRTRSDETKKKISKTWFRDGDIPWNRGKKPSLETRRKLSEALRGRKAWNKGKKLPEDVKKKLSELAKGKHWSPKTEFKKGQYAGAKNPAKRMSVRRKIREAKIGRPHLNQRGENHPNWKGGITPPNEKLRRTLKYKTWRRAVFARDNWTCQKCKQRGATLHAHHFHNFATHFLHRTSVQNGITLCKTCHTKFHKTYGIKNNTKEEFEEFTSAISHLSKRRQKT
jgi:hypothetical protein